MTKMTSEPTDHQIPINEWLAARKRAGLEIDPETAEVMWCYGHLLDPYDAHADLTDEGKCIGRVFFARNPGSDIWVAFHDLPKETLAKLRGSGRERRALAEFEADFAELAWLSDE